MAKFQDSAIWDSAYHHIYIDTPPTQIHTSLKNPPSPAHTYLPVTMNPVQLLVAFVAGLVFQHFADIDIQATISAVPFPQTISNHWAVPDVGATPHPLRFATVDKICLRQSAPLLSSPPAPPISTSAFIPHLPYDTCPPLLPIQLISTCPLQLQTLSLPPTMAAISKTCPCLVPIELVDAPLATTIYGLAIATRQYGFIPVAPNFISRRQYLTAVNHRTNPMPGPLAASCSPQGQAIFKPTIHNPTVPKGMAKTLIITLAIVVPFVVALYLFIARVPVAAPSENLDSIVRELYTSALLSEIHKLLDEKDKNCTLVHKWYKRSMEGKTRLRNRISDLKDRVSTLNGQVTTSDDRILRLIDDHSNNVLSVQQKAEDQRRDLTRTHNVAVTRLQQEREALVKAMGELTAQLEEANRLRNEAQSRESRIGDVFGDNLKAIMVDHYAGLAAVSTNYQEATESQGRCHALVLKEKDERIRELEGSAASTEAAWAERELCAPECDCTESLSEASPPSTTSPLPPTAELDQTYLSSAPELPSNIQSSEDSSPSTVVEVDNSLASLTSSSSSAWTPSRSAYSENPRGSSESIWASHEDEIATPIAPRPTGNKYPHGRHGSKPRANNRNNKSSGMYGRSHFSIPKRSGPQTAYDAHDHR